MQWFGRGQTQALALPDGIVGQAAMPSQHLALPVIDWPWSRDRDERPAAARRARSHGRALLRQHSSVTINEAALIVLSHKADLLALRLACHAQTAFRSHRTHLRLGILAQGKAGMRQLLLVEHMKHIR